MFTTLICDTLPNFIPLATALLEIYMRHASIRLVITHRASLTTPTGAVARLHTTHAQKLDEKKSLATISFPSTNFFSSSFWACVVCILATAQVGVVNDARCVITSRILDIDTGRNCKNCKGSPLDFQSACSFSREYFFLCRMLRDQNNFFHTVII